ncbi:MAG: class B sortase [Lachnospiraceae bacterium]|nr:class B sortase [Lachnospiraceae bacterium]
MKDNKDRILKNVGLFTLGIIGLVAAFFIARAISAPDIQEEPNIAFGDEISLETISDDMILVKEIEDFTQPAEAAMSEEQIEEILSTARISTTTTLTQTTEINTDTPEPPVTAALNTNSNQVIDFDKIWEVNKDVYAWIKVAGTKIDYPILQHATDNSYYLNYNIDGSYGYPGCVYTENLNKKDFKDPNTVIYAHNMKNGTMFAPLHKFRDKDFFDKNREITIYMPDKTLTYEIFAAYYYDDRHIMYSFDFAKEDVFERYLKSIFDTREMGANIDKTISVTKDDKIITLATCISGKPENRMLVQAVLKQ